MASERGKGQTAGSNICGVRTSISTAIDKRGAWEGAVTEGESPVVEIESRVDGSRVPRDTRNRRGKMGGPPSKPKYYSVTDSEAVP